MFVGFVGLLNFWILFGCTATAPSDTHPFDDEEIRAIAQFADDRNLKGILPYLKHSEAKYVAYAAQCLGSFGDSIPVASLLPLTVSNDSLVAAHAAWAIGQKGDSTACAALIKAYTEHPTNGALLTALARSMPNTPGPIQSEAVRFLQQLRLDQPHIIMAFSDALYHVHYRSIFDASLFDKLIQSNLPASDLWLRKAQAIGRYRGVLREEYQTNLTSYLDRNIHPDLALALIPSLMQVNDTMATAFIQNKLLSDSMDTRVELMYCNVLLRKCQMDETILLSLLDMGQASVQRTILQQVIRIPISENFQNYIITAEFSEEDLRAYSLFYEVKQGDMTNEEFLVRYHHVPEGYGRIRWIPLIGELDNGHVELFSQIRNTQHLALRYALTEEWMNRQARENYADVDLSELDIIWQIGDIGLNALLCEHLLKVELDHSQKLTWATKLRDYLNKLSLPQEIETYEMVRSAAEKLDPQGSVSPQVKSTYTLDWELIRRIPRDAQVRINTNKGSMIMTLDVEQAPGSVANFVNLVRQGFYNGKYFHRMVPNFVVQGGCPRGDGMGSTPYTLRSEFTPLTYSTGTVGLASSGRDTESCQWFISLIPTPHLDGRYTIIGRITSGMQHVAQLEVGDQIISIEPINFTF